MTLAPWGWRAAAPRTSAAAGGEPLGAQREQLDARRPVRSGGAQDAEVEAPGAQAGDLCGAGLLGEDVAALLERGALRVYATARDRSALDVVATDERVVPLTLDLTDADAVAAVAAATTDVSLLVNNAGAAAFAPLLDAPRADIQQEITTNVLGTLDLIRACVPAMEPAARWSTSCRCSRSPRRRAWPATAPPRPPRIR